MAIVAGIIVGLLLVLPWLRRSKPADWRKLMRWLPLWILIGGLILLAATGRLSWIFALFAALVPVVNRLLSLLRYLPVFSQLYRAVHGQRTAAGSASGARGGGSSQVETGYLRMLLDHATGAMSGEVLAGTFAGRRLDALTLPELLDLYNECRNADAESEALLATYLDRQHDGWRDQLDPAAGEQRERQADANGGTGDMSRSEAAEVLGVAPDATAADVVAAHRRLMQKLHPDRGGSTYLAAKLNQAKDLLLG